MVRLKIKYLCKAGDRGELQEEMNESLQWFRENKQTNKNQTELKSYELVLSGKLIKWWNHWKIHLRNQKSQHKIWNIEGNTVRDVKILLKKQRSLLFNY